MAILGDVKCFVQANNGDILLGTNDAARIYKSSDNGQTWTLVISLGSTAGVTGLVKDSNGRLFATVILGAATQGIWRSANDGATWTRVYTNPVTPNGYSDITAIRWNNVLVATGYGTSAGPGNVVSSSDGGVTWVVSDVGVNLRPLHAKKVSSSELGLLAWFGYESVTPMTTQTTPGGGSLATYRNTIPVEGIDVAIFNYMNTGGVAEEARIWAAQNGSNAEIWKYNSVHLTNLGSGSTAWAKVATISSAEFFVLYVDPIPVHTTQNRTIWAGAVGKIYVSYNNGLAWAVATEAPVGEMYAFIRTVSGVLIAGGEAGEIFLYSGSGGSEGGGDPEEEEPSPIPDPITVTSSRLLGREATCEDEVYVSNKTAFSTVTHVLYYNGSTYEELQFATVLPYYLFGTTPAVGRIAYFGSRTTDSNVPSGTFSSLIFDITQTAETLTLVWEYWNGSAWTTLTTQDNTSQFRVLGVKSVHWATPTAWVTTSVNAVTGYWVRARVTALGTNNVAPIHDNRYIYTVNLPYVEIAEEEINGDVPALMKVKWNNRADDLSTNLSLQLDRLVCGLRSIGRGVNFNAYLNISDVQALFGVAISKDVDGSWTTSNRAPTNRMLSVSYSSAGRLNTWNNLVTFTFSNTVARDYYGQYRAFVRCYKVGSGSNNWQIRLKSIFGSGGGSVISKTVFPTLAAEWEVLDFGQISIPTVQVAQQIGNIGDQLSLTIQGYNTSTNIAIQFFDLILIPHDEWAVDTLAPELATTATTDVKGSYYMDIDSITNPKATITALNRNAAGQIVSRYQAINNGPAILQKGRAQKLWFLGMSYENFWRGFPEIAGSIEVSKQQRYLGFRGRN